MEVSFIYNGAETEIVLNGRLDTVNAPEFEQKIKPVMESDVHRVILNCTDFSYISSSGLRIFLTLQKWANANGRKLVIRAMRPELLEVFKITGFTALFTFE